MNLAPASIATPAPRILSLALLSLAMAACSTPAPVTIAPPTAPMIALLAHAASGALPSHADIRAAYLAFDATRNGAIDAAEWQQASVALFDLTDKNRDGAIERTELGTNALIREAFPSIDEGRNGRLTRDEFIELRDVIFRAADIDRNGYVTFVEYELLVLLRRTGWTDRNRDGRIAMSELETVLAQAFLLLDENHDGALAGDETAFLSPESIAAMDPRHTGRIAPGQLVNGYRFLLGADQINRNLVARETPL